MSDRDELARILARDDLAGIILDAHATGNWDEACAAADEILDRYNPTPKGSAWGDFESWEKAVRASASRDELADVIAATCPPYVEDYEFAHETADAILTRWRLIPASTSDALAPPSWTRFPRALTNTSGCTRGLLPPVSAASGMAHERA